MPSELPIPLNLLQAAKATDISGLKLIFPVLAKAIGANTPNVDFTEFIQKVSDFEKKYTFWDKCNKAFEELNKVDSQIIPALKNGQPVLVDLTESQANYLKPYMNFLKDMKIIALEPNGNAKVTTYGTYYDFNLIQMSEFNRIIKDQDFKF